METKFTKGEWSYFKCMDDVDRLFFTVESKLECGESRFICDTAEHITSDTDDAAPSMGECEANYNLIATAPEMYRALIRIQQEGGLSVARHKSISGLLAKARGEK